MGELFDGGYTYDPGAWRAWTTTTDGRLRSSGYTYNPYASSFTVDIPSMWPRLTEDEFRKRMSIELDKEDESKVSVRKIESHVMDEQAVVCDDPKDLSVERILTTLSVVKGKLMWEVAPRRVESLECSITPAVKQNIITASKKLKMYGKEMPIIPHFDEWGTRLPDEIVIGNHSGITLKIVNPEDFGEFYYELKATLSMDDFLSSLNSDLSHMFRDCEPFTDLDTTTLYDSEKKTR